MAEIIQKIWREALNSDESIAPKNAQSNCKIIFFLFVYLAGVFQIILSIYHPCWLNLSTLLVDTISQKELNDIVAS